MLITAQQAQWNRMKAAAERCRSGGGGESNTGCTSVGELLITP